MLLGPLKNRRHQFLLSSIITALIVLVGCSTDDSFDFGAPQSKTYEYNIGPEGGTIEIKDYSAIDGFKMVIPQGALAATTKISIISYVDAPDLSDGLSSYNPNLELRSSAPFLKDIQIGFPVFEFPEDTDEMICAFFWNASLGIWQVVMPESFTSDLMTVQTQHFSFWQWGEVVIEDVESETMEPMIDQLFGPDYIDRLAEAMDLESLGLIDWKNLDYCDNQTEIADTFREVKDDAKMRAEDELDDINTTCEIWKDPPPSNDLRSATLGDLFYGVDEYIDINLRYLGQQAGATGLEMVPYFGGILSIIAKAQARAIYEQSLENLKNEYVCIFTEAESTLWLDAGLFVAAETALFGMQLAESELPCP